MVDCGNGKTFQTPDLRSLAIHSDEISVIDLGGLDGPDHTQTLAEISRSCSTYGFFQVVNHGVDIALLDTLRHAYKEFFDLPEKEKLEYAIDDQSAIGGYHKQKNIRADGSSFFNEWISVVTYLDPWQGVPKERSFRDIVEKYMVEARSLANRLLEVMTEILGLPSQTLQEKCNGSGNSGLTLRVNCYHPWGTELPDIGLDSHCDGGIITLLLQDESPGLQVKIKDRWIEIKPNLKAIVVNIGDQVEILSNGRFISSEHRGLADRDVKRLSFATFYSPNLDSEIGPIEELIDETHPARYKTIKFHDYLVNYFSSGAVGTGRGYLQTYSLGPK